MDSEGQSTSVGTPRSEGEVIELLWNASAERVRAESDAVGAATTARSRNDRMNAAAVAALERSHAEQIAAIESEFAAQAGEIEDKAARATVKVDEDEAELRARTSRTADDHEEHINRSLQHKLWMAESVYEAAVPALRKALSEAIAGLERHQLRIAATEERATAVARSFRQTLPAEDGAPAAPTDPARIEEHLARLDRALVELSACRTARLFRGPILAVPFLLLTAAGAAAGAAALPAELGPALSASIGAASAALLAAAGTFALFVGARREVRAAGARFRAEAAAARQAVSARRLEVEQDFASKESAARRTRDAETAAAEAKYRPRLNDLTKKVDEALDGIAKRVPHYKAKVLRQRAINMAAVEDQRDRLRTECDGRRQAALAEERERHAAVAAEQEASQAAALAEAEARWRIARERIGAGVAELEREAAASPAPWNDPSWTSWTPPSTMPEAISIGTVALELGDVARAVSPGASATPPWIRPGESLELPVCLRAADRMSLVVSAPSSRRADALRILQNAVARLLCAIPPGKARFTFVDPIGLGQSFAGFMHLADEHPQLVSDRIWTDARHVEQRMADLTEHMETVIQKYLRNEYRTLEDYNRQAGEIAEPFRFLVMADFPTNVSEGAAKRLASILQSGARCGVHVLLLRDPKDALPATIEEADLASTARIVRWTDGDPHPDEAGGAAGPGWSVDGGRLAALRMSADPPPDDGTLLRITRQVGAAAKDSSRVEVPFAAVAPRPEQRWTASSADRLRVPIGRAGANRLQYLALGEGTCQHALVAGKTGSGKSSLLNAMIVNSALWHAPSELELWLIDFKKGVEFKAYATAGMPHVRVVAVESDREFGLSVLQGLDDELRRRGELFRSAGVQSISDWRALGRGEHMPRSLLVVDEFQELFIEDDKVAQDSALLLDRLVRQGRAFGMHAVLGSQTLGGAYGIARSTMGQMGVRIALQCAEADSQLILSDDNLAARLLSRPGEAIYNDAGGRLEGNNPFQVVWLPDEVRTACLREIAAGTRTPAGRPAPIVFEGNLPADPDTNTALAAALAGPGAANASPRLWLGDPVSIKEPTAAVLPRRSGSNMVVVGQSEESGPALLAMSMVALAAQHPPGGMEMTVLEGLGAPGSPDAPLTRVVAAIMPPLHATVFGPRTADDALLAIGRELARRLESGAPEDLPHYLVIDGLHRFRSLRRNENDFSFDDSGPKTPDRILALLLKEGPAVGIHVLAWVDTVANLQRAFDRTSLREINWKALFQMSANDSSTIIDSPAASRLGPHRALLSDDDAGIVEKFRPYPMPDGACLEKLAEAVRRRVD